jgi:hypothetical protein
MKHNFRLFSAVAATWLLVAGCASASTPAPAAGQATVDRISKRLAGLGVPVRSVRVTSTAPLAVEITFMEARSPTQVSDQVLWDGFVVERVAMLAYLDGDPLSSYKIIEVNPKGDYVGSSTQNLFPNQPSQQLKSSEVFPVIDDAATRTRLLTRLNTYGLPVTTLSVRSGGVARPNTQVVELHLTAASIDAANRVINTLVPSVTIDARKANGTGEARVAILRLKVYDTKGTLLVHYIHDLETGVEMGNNAPGIEATWYPQPLPIGPVNSPLPTPTHSGQ